MNDPFFFSKFVNKMKRDMRTTAYNVSFEQFFFVCMDCIMLYKYFIWQKCRTIQIRRIAILKECFN